MNKRGQIGDIILSVILLIVVGLVVFFILGETEVISMKFNPDTANAFVKWIWNGGVAIKDVFWKIAVPSGLNGDNQEVIAFAMFLLLFIIGTHALRNFFQNKFLSVLVAFLVAVIAGRALTATIIESYIIGSPLASSAILIGLIPIMIIYGIVDNWSSGKYGIKMLIWIIAAILYLVVFIAIGNESIGWMYFAFVLLAGIIDVFAPLIKQGIKTNARKEIGKFISMSHEDLQTWETARTAAVNSFRRRTTVPSAPWTY